MVSHVCSSLDNGQEYPLRGREALLQDLEVLQAKLFDIQYGRKTRQPNFAWRFERRFKRRRIGRGGANQRHGKRVFGLG